MRNTENVDLINLDKNVSDSTFDDSIDITREIVSKLTLDPDQPQGRPHIHSVFTPWVSTTIIYCSSITKEVDVDTIGHNDGPGCFSNTKPGTWCGGI